MVNTTDFVLNGTMITKYTGAGGDVTIPEGITEICDCAFDGVAALKTVTVNGDIIIGRGAFQRCRNLTKVTINGDAAEIRECAFDACKKLSAFSVSGKIGSVCANSFDKCENLFNDDGFLILSGILVDCRSENAHVVIPDGVTKIEGCSAKTIVSVFVPGSVTEVSDFALSGKGMKYLSIPKSLWDAWASSGRNVSRVFGELSFTLAVRDGEKNVCYTYAGARPADYFKDDYTSTVTSWLLPGKWEEYDKELINNGPAFKYKAPARLLGCLSRLTAPTELTDAYKSLYLELLIKNAKKLIPIAEELRCPAIVGAMKEHGIINAKNKKAIAQLLAASAVPEIAAMAEL